MPSLPSRRPAFRRSFVLALGLVLFPAVPAAAQTPQANTAAARLSINGTGLVPAPNLAPTWGSLPVNSSGTPAPPTTAPLLVEDLMARAAIELRVQGGAPLLPVIVAAGTPSGTQILIPGGNFELNPFNFVYLINGLDPSNLINATAVLGAGSGWSLVLPQGLPPGFPSLTFQAAVVDPSVATGYTLTSSLTLRIRNDIPTLLKNTADAHILAPQNPLYLASLLDSGFRWDGYDAAAQIADAIASNAGLALSPFPLLFTGHGANAPGAANPPSGAPSSGQVATLYAAFQEQEPADCEAPSGRAPQSRSHDLRIAEELGVWRLAGNQNDFLAEATIEFRENPSAPSPGYAATLHFTVEDELGFNGGIESVTVNGPQLDAINGSGAATTPTTATVDLFYCGSNGHGSDWCRSVTVGQVGTSRLPRVEGGPSAVDVYVFTVDWIDPVPNSTVTVPLRCAIVPETDPTGVAVRAAIPGNGATPPTTSLAGPGAPGAALSLTFPVTALAAALHSGYDITVSQSPLSFDFEDLALTPAGGQISATFCTPLLAVCPPMTSCTTVELTQLDVYGNEFVASWSVQL